MFNQLTKASSLLLLFFPLAMAAEVDIYLNDGVTVSDIVGGESTNWGLAFNGYGPSDWANKKFTLHIDGVGDPQCYLQGAPESEFSEPTFQIYGNANYLQPCGPLRGVTVVCNDPAATCNQ